jgi:hypothetical protein
MNLFDRSHLMQRWNLTVALLMFTMFLCACDASSRNSLYDIFGRPTQAESATNTRGDVIERLVPEEGANRSRKRTRAVIEATMRVTGLPRHELPEQPLRVRQVLGGLSFSELQRIEALVPEVEANPKLEWDD